MRASTPMHTKALLWVICIAFIMCKDTMDECNMYNTTKIVTTQLFLHHFYIFPCNTITKY